VSEPTALILSDIYDFSTDLVVLRLEEAGIPFVRLNRRQFSDYRITLDPLTPELCIRSPSEPDRTLSRISSVLFRQPVFLRNTPSTPLSPEIQLARSQWMAFLRSLCVFTDALWMNHPSATYLAECKPYQLTAAYECQFKVPRTLAGNDVNRIREEFPESLAIKSLDTVLLMDGDDCLFTYTKLNPGSEMTDQTVGDAPLLAQALLDCKTDIRVTVIEDTVFAVRITEEGRGIAGDWRLVPRDRLRYEDFDLDDEVRNSCVALTRKLGLHFAAIDLVQTPGGIYFIEVNPTGEWGWITTADRAIDSAIASWLERATYRN